MRRVISVIVVAIHVPAMTLALATIFLAVAASAQSEDHKVLIRDVSSVEGIRNNSLIG